MDIQQFIALFKRHIVLLIVVPIILAITVFLFTRNMPKSYTSSATIFTGIATGYSIETTSQRPVDYFSINVQFDNVINIINSRNTQENTAIQLFVQGLMLEAPDHRYISAKHYEELHQLVPKHIKDLCYKNAKMGLEREKEEQIRILESDIKSLQKEISKKKNQQVLQQGQNITPTNVQTNEISGGYVGLDKSVPLGYNQQVDNASLPVYHTVEVGESIQTIASKYGISRGRVLELNDLPDGSVRVGQTLIIQEGVSTTFDYHIVEAGETIFSVARKYGVSLNELKRLNNLTSNNLSTGQRLIVGEYYPNEYSEDYTLSTSNISSGDYNNPPPAYMQNNTLLVNLRKSPYYNPDDQSNDKEQIVPPGVNVHDFWATVKNFEDLYHSSDTNFIYGLLNYGAHPHYSINAIRGVRTFRKNNSDLVELQYTNNDPGITMQTLRIISKVFGKNFMDLRINQTDAVVRYFQQQVDSADLRLQDAEDRLLQFNKQNNIINYYEQSKYIADRKEELDLFIQNAQIQMAASAAKLKELATKLTARDSIYLKSDAIQQRMKMWSDLTELIAINEINEGYDPTIGNKLDDLRRQRTQTRNEIKHYVDQLYLYQHTPEGIPIKDIFVEWLGNTLGYEEAKASLKVLQRRKLDFLKVYQIFAPLGAILKRIEREIDVAEQTYLELLRSLNEAKMRQQNLAMSNNIKVLDPAFFPVSANSSKTRFLILLAAMTGFVMVAFLILMFEFFDSTVKSPERIEKITKLKLAGAYPKIAPNSQSIDYENISSRLIELLAQNIKIHISQNAVYSSEKPYLVLFFSTQKETGKTTLATHLIQKLRSYGENILFLNYSKEKDDTFADMNDTIRYSIDNRFVEIKHINELLKLKYLRSDNYNYDYIFLEIPSIMHHNYPLDLMNAVDVSLLVVKANDHWKKADISAIETISEIAKEKPMVVLNNAELYALEDIISGIPKRKGATRREKIKKVLLYPFRMKVRVRIDKTETK